MQVFKENSIATVISNELLTDDASNFEKSPCIFKSHIVLHGTQKLMWLTACFYDMTDSLWIISGYDHRDDP